MEEDRRLVESTYTRNEAELTNGLSSALFNLGIGYKVYKDKVYVQACGETKDTIMSLLRSAPKVKAFVEIFELPAGMYSPVETPLGPNEFMFEVSYHKPSKTKLVS